MHVLVVQLLVKIRQGYNLRKQYIYVYKFNKRCLVILNLLHVEGFIITYRFDTKLGCIVIYLKYTNGRCALTQLQIFTTPFMVNFKMLKQLMVLRNRFGVFGLWTSRGFISDKQALLFSEGGQIFFYIE